MKHICFISSAFGRDDSLIVMRQGRSLAESGFQVTYLVCDDQPDAFDKGIHYISTGYKPKSKKDRLKNNPRIIKEKLAEIDADVYQIAEPELFRVGFWLKRKGKKVIYNMREWYPGYYSRKFKNNQVKKFVHFLSEKYLKHSVKRFDAVVSCLVDKSEYIRKRLPCKLFEDVTNYPLIDHDFSLSFEEYCSRKPVVCYFGSIYTNSCQEEMLDALTDFPEVTYLLAGIFYQDSYQQKLMQKAAWKQVEFINGFKREELPSIINQAVIGNVVRDFSKTGSPNGSRSVIKIYETMEAGVPVVLSKVPLYEKMVEKYHCGICINPHSVEDFKNAIAYLLTHKKEAYEMGQNGRKAVLEEYSWDSQYKKYLSVIEKLLNQ